jgi:hypothetical protein
VVNLHAQIDNNRVVLAPEWSEEVYKKGHIGYDTTHTFDWPVITYKGKPTRKYFHASIARLSSGTYEVVSYVL